MTGTPAAFWEAAGEQIRCTLCPHLCRLAEGQAGLCGVRQVAEGRLTTRADGWLVAAHATPIETKPFYHFAPGGRAFSFGAPGCTMSCSFCQNWQVSQLPKGGAGPAPAAWSPEALVAAAVEGGCVALAATFTEPTLLAEYWLRLAPVAAAAGLALLWKTNGFTSPAVVAALSPHLAGVNVDLKAWAPARWQALGAAREPVLAATAAYAAAGLHVELTTVLDPEQWADEREFAGLSAWILEHLGPDVPWHLNRWHPDYLAADGVPVSAETLRAGRDAARAAGHRYVYTDADEAGRTTHCPACGAAVLRRGERGLLEDRRRGGGCACGQALPIVAA